MCVCVLVRACMLLSILQIINLKYYFSGGPSAGVKDRLIWRHPPSSFLPSAGGPAVVCMCMCVCVVVLVCLVVAVAGYIAITNRKPVSPNVNFKLKIKEWKKIIINAFSYHCASNQCRPGLPQTTGHRATRAVCSVFAGNGKRKLIPNWQLG